jgi:hypothetical protein
MAFPGNFDRTIAHAMPAEARSALLALNNCYEDKIIGVLRTNNWGVGALPGHDAPYGGTGAIISRINHRYVSHPSRKSVLALNSVHKQLCAERALQMERRDVRG